MPYPPDKGERIRSYQQLRWLAERHEIDLLSLAQRREEAERAVELEGWCRRVEVFRCSRPAGLARVAVGLLGRRPLTLSYFRSSRLERRTLQLAAVGSYDAVVACSSSMAPYALALEGVPRLLDMVDVDSEKWVRFGRHARPWWRPVYRLEAARLRAYERHLTEHFDRIVLTTQREVAVLRSFAGSASAAAIPTGVDAERFRPAEPSAEGPPHLVFTGQMDYFANVDGIVHFARAVFPRLRQRFPALELVIVGRSPSSAVRALAKRPGIRVTGEVPDVRPYLARGRVFVAPLRIALGVQTKVLEAMASGLPAVVSTAVLEGLSDGRLTADRHLLAGADDEELGRSLGRLLEDGELRRRIAEAGRRKVLSEYAWQSTCRRFELELEALARRRQGPEPSAAAKREGARGAA